MSQATKTYRDNPAMQELLNKATPVRSLMPGEVVEGAVIFRGKNKLIIDVEGTSTGIISGRELRDSFSTFQTLKIGSPVTAMVLEEENEEGMVVMSLRRVSQQKAWERIHLLISKDETMPFVPQEANKGGLLANIDGIRTFLPVSQLAPINYPRVSNADPNEIITRLGKFIGHTFTVKIITVDEDAGKIVVSEREAMSEQRAKVLEGLRVGDIKEGRVSGVVNFGIFVTFDGLEGLVHISEIAWGHVKNPSEFAKVGDKVKVRVIGLEGEKLSLSIKQMQQDPWEEIAEKYPVGKKAKGTIMKLTDYGAFVKLETEVNGLVHLSELAHHKVADPADILNVGQKIDVQVINIEPDERRIGLSIKALQPITKEMLEEIRREKEAEEGEEGTGTGTGTGTGVEENTKEKVGKKSAKKSEGQFVASKTGKKYYPVDSAGAKKIKKENRVEFDSAKEAEKAGYTV